MSKVFAINPGSTSTKIALFEDDKCLYSKNVQHDARVLSGFLTISEQLPYRKKIILEALSEAKVGFTEIDAVVGRGGSSHSMESGTYEIDDLLLEHTRNAVGGVLHPANLGVQLAAEFAKINGVKAYTVNPPVVDELQDVARITGIKGVYRAVALHALNLKETAIRHAASVGTTYENANFIVCHIGGGISVSAHKKGRMIDGFDISAGEGPLAPTRCGAIPVTALMDYMEQNQKSVRDIRNLCIKNGGFVDYFGSSDAQEIAQQAKCGDKTASRVWDAMIYQIEKCIGGMAAVLEGQIDAILLGGGMAHAEDLVNHIKKSCSWIAPVVAYPGEFEMEALAAGVIRILAHEEVVKRYTGAPVWSGFD